MFLHTFQISKKKTSFRWTEEAIKLRAKMLRTRGLDNDIFSELLVIKNDFFHIIFLIVCHAGFDVLGVS